MKALSRRLPSFSVRYLDVYEGYSRDIIFQVLSDDNSTGTVNIPILQFESRFECGNLRKAIQVRFNLFNLKTSFYAQQFSPKYRICSKFKRSFTVFHCISLYFSVFFLYRCGYLSTI